MEGQTAIGINSLAVCFYSTMNHGIKGGDKLKEADSHCNNCKTHPLTLFARVFFFTSLQQHRLGEVNETCQEHVCVIFLHIESFLFLRHYNVLHGDIFLHGN